MKFRTLSRSRRNRAFTLIELMVVVLILAVLAALVVPRIVGAGDKAKVDATRSEMASIKGMISHFKLDTGRYPSSDEGLDALRNAPSGLEGKWGPSAYADKDIVNDPFGFPYIYEADGSSFTLTSTGMDGQQGGEGYDADLTVTD